MNGPSKRETPLGGNIMFLGCKKTNHFSVLFICVCNDFNHLSIFSISQMNCIVYCLSFLCSYLLPKLRELHTINDLLICVLSLLFSLSNLLGCFYTMQGWCVNKDTYVNIDNLKLKNTLKTILQVFLWLTKQMHQTMPPFYIITTINM